MIKHVVMWKFREETEKKQDIFLNKLLALKDEIKEIKEIEVGKSIKENNDYDAILISKFETLEALKKYKEDERHVKVSNLCKEIRVDRTSIDINCD